MISSVPYNNATTNDMLIKNTIPPMLIPSLIAFCFSRECTLSMYVLKRCCSKLKFANDATVLMLYNTSSAIPPAVSYAFLLLIIKFLSDVTKNIMHTIMNGLTHNITNVNFHDALNAIDNPDIN